MLKLQVELIHGHEDCHKMTVELSGYVKDECVLIQQGYHVF